MKSANIKPLKSCPIQEMAEVIKSSLDGLGSGNFNFTGDEISAMFANTLYNAGYRKQSGGEWEVKIFGLTKGKKVTCSCCGFSVYRGPCWDISWGMYNFCPNCGAKMKGGDGK